MKLNVDMSNVQEGFELLPEGEYICKVTGVTKEPGTKAPYLKWELTVGIGPQKGKKINNITTLSPKALFALRDFLIACGLNVPKSAMTLDTDQVKGKIVGIVVTHGTYVKDGVEKPNANITELFRVQKTDAGWKRVGTAKAAPAEVEDEEVFESPSTVVEEDEIEEIEI
jgi:hypothetical protein